MHLDGRKIGMNENYLNDKDDFKRFSTAHRKYAMDCIKHDPILASIIELWTTNCRLFNIDVSKKSSLASYFTQGIKESAAFRRIVRHYLKKSAAIDFGKFHFESDEIMRVCLTMRAKFQRLILGSPRTPSTFYVFRFVIPRQTDTQIPAAINQHEFDTEPKTQFTSFSFMPFGSVNEHNQDLMSLRFFHKWGNCCLILGRLPAGSAVLWIPPELTPFVQDELVLPIESSYCHISMPREVEFVYRPIITDLEVVTNKMTNVFSQIRTQTNLKWTKRLLPKKDHRNAALTTLWVADNPVTNTLGVLTLDINTIIL